MLVTAPGGEPPPWLEVPFEHEAAAVSPRALARGAVPRIDVPLPAVAQAVLPTALGDRWATLVRQMCDAGSISAMARELAMQAQCLELNEQADPVRCRLRVERESLRVAAHCDKLQAALADTLLRAVHLEAEAGAVDDSPARRDAAERALRQARAEDAIRNDPLVLALMAQYKTARIMPGSVKPH